MEQDATVGLPQVIEALRKDLNQAIEQGKGQVVQFDVNEIEVELRVALEESRKGDGSLGFAVFKVGGSFDDKTIKGHTIKLKLKPSQLVAESDGSTNATKVSISGKATRLQ